MSAALAPATNSLTQPTHLATTSKPKKTLRSSIQETLRSATGHGRQNRVPISTSVSSNSESNGNGVANGSALSSTDDLVGTTNRTMSNDPRARSRATTTSPPTIASTSNDINDKNTTRGGGFLKLGKKIASVRDRQTKSKATGVKDIDDSTLRQFQAPTLRSGTLSDPALHTLARRAKHQPLLSLAAAFDPHSTSSTSTLSSQKSQVDAARTIRRTVSPIPSTPSSSSSRPAISTPIPLARSSSVSRSRPPTAGTPVLSSAKPLQRVPSNKGQPPVSGSARSRLTSPSSPSLTTSDHDATTIGQNSTRPTSPPPIQQRSALRSSTGAGATSSSTTAKSELAANEAGKNTRAGNRVADDGTITARKLSVNSPTSTCPPPTAVPSTPSRIVNASSSKPSSPSSPAPTTSNSNTTSGNSPSRLTSRPKLTSASTSNLHLNTPHSRVSSPVPPGSPVSANPATTVTTARRRNSSSILPPPISTTSPTGASRARSPTPTTPVRNPERERMGSVTHTSTSRSSSPVVMTSRGRTPAGAPPVAITTRRGSTSRAPSMTRSSSNPTSINAKKTGSETADDEIAIKSRNAIRKATAFILVQSISPPSELLRSSPLIGKQWLEEMEVRTRGLDRVSRLWRDGENVTTVVGVRDIKAETRERNAFCEALRDGYVLCQLFNKWRPNTVSRIDHREDGVSKSTNIANFSTCLRRCVDSTDTSRISCTHDDFLQCTPSSMLRVAETVMVLQKVVDDISEKNGGRSASSTPSPPNSAQQTRPITRPSIFTPPVKPHTPTISTSSSGTGTTRRNSSGPLTGTTAVSSPSSFIDPNTRVWAGSPAQAAAQQTLAKKTLDKRGSIGLGVSSSASASTPNLIPGNGRATPTRSVSNPQVDIPILKGQGQRLASSNAAVSASMQASNSSPAPAKGPSQALMSAVAASEASKRSSLPPITLNPSTPPPARSSGSRYPPTQYSANRSSFASTATNTSMADSLFDNSSNHYIRSHRISDGKLDKYGSIKTNITVPSINGASLTKSEARDVVREMEEMGMIVDDGWNGSSDTVHNMSSTPLSSRRDRRTSEAAGDLVRVLEEESEDASPNGKSRLQPLSIPSGGRAVMGPPLSRPPLLPRVSSSPTKTSGLMPKALAQDSEDVFYDDDGNVPHASSSRDRARGYSPYLSSRNGPRWPEREASPSPVRVGSSGISSSPSRRHSGRLVPKGSGISGSSNRRFSGSRTSVDLTLSQGNESTSSLTESALNPTQLLPASTKNSEGASPIPFPKRTSSDGLRLHPKAPTLVGRNSNGPSTVSRSQSNKPSDEDDSPPPSQRPGFQRSRILSDSTADGSTRNRFSGPGKRARFESMIDITTTSMTGSREALATPPLRKTLVVKEDGHPATQFQLGNCIGRGQFGSVYRALNMTTGQVVAVKQISLLGLPENEVTQLMQEVHLLKSLEHPSVVKYEGMSRDSEHLSIVLEYVENGSLGQTLKAFGKLNERLVASYVAKILEGLNYLHQSEVVHCDLKAANILTTKNGNIKLSDFGVSLNLRTMENIKNNVAGTPNWMAPEVIELKGVSPASDIWSLGCTVIELLTGKPPYSGIHNGLSVMYRIVDDDGPPLPAGCSPALQDFFAQCFNKDSTKRPSAEELFEHPWLKDTFVELQSLGPQDSVPFLRRVSTDLSRRTSFANQMPFVRVEASVPESMLPSPVESPETPSIPRPHTFIKTTFSQAVECRVCWTPVRKSAMFCQGCNIICHSRCVVEADTCDVLEQARKHTERVKQQVASPPTSPAPTRARKISLINRNSVPVPPAAPSQAMTSSLSSPPSAYPYSVTTAAWKKIRNSTTSDVGVLLTSLTTASPISDDLENGRQGEAHHSRLATNGTGTTGSSGGVSSGSGSGSGSGIRSDDGESILSGHRRRVSVAMTVSSGQAPSTINGDSLPRNAPAPSPAPTAAELNPTSPLNPRSIRKKTKGDESNCIMQ